jgi:hypothetical protein
LAATTSPLYCTRYTLALQQYSQSTQCMKGKSQAAVRGCDVMQPERVRKPGNWHSRSNVPTMQASR